MNYYGHKLREIRASWQRNLTDISIRCGGLLGVNGTQCCIYSLSSDEKDGENGEARVNHECEVYD